MYFKKAIDQNNNKIHYKMFWGEGFKSRLGYVFEKTLTSMTIFPGFFAPLLLSLAKEKINQKVNNYKNVASSSYNGELQKLLGFFVYILNIIILIPLIILSLLITIALSPFIAVTTLLTKILFQEDKNLIKNSLLKIDYNQSNIPNAAKINKDDIREMFSCTKPSCEFANENKLTIKYTNKVWDDTYKEYSTTKEDEIHITNPKPELLLALYRTNFGDCRNNDKFMHPRLKDTMKKTLADKMPDDIINIIGSLIETKKETEAKSNGYHITKGYR